MKDTLRQLLTDWLAPYGIPVLVVRGFGSQSYVDVVRERTAGDPRSACGRRRADLNEMTAAIGDVDADDEMVKAAPSRDTIQRIIKGPALPARQADGVALMIVLTRVVGERRSRLGRVLPGCGWTRASSGRSQPTGELDPIDLEVHRAIEVDDVTDLTHRPALPAYVSRPHDRLPHLAVQKAAKGESQLVMLGGGSSTGKTRACWEAVQQLPESWRLWHPIDPERPEHHDAAQLLAYGWDLDGAIAEPWDADDEL